jgi:hypothetical protein
LSIVHAGTIVLPEGKDGNLEELMRQWREDKPYDPAQGHGMIRTTWSEMTFFESSSRSRLLLGHDLFRKPVFSPDQVRARLFRIML